MIPFLSFSLPMQEGNALSDCNIALRDEEEESLLGEPSYKEKRKWCIQNTNMTRHESSVSKWKYFWFWQKYKIHYFMGFFLELEFMENKNMLFSREHRFLNVSKNVSKNIPIPKMLSRKCFLSSTWRCLSPGSGQSQAHRQAEQRMAWEQPWGEGFRSVSWWKIQDELAMCICSPEGQVGCIKRSMTSRSRELILPLCSHENSPGIFCPVIGSPA